jgi:hypothetical protein
VLQIADLDFIEISLSYLSLDLLYIDAIVLDLNIFFLDLLFYFALLFTTLAALHRFISLVAFRVIAFLIIVIAFFNVSTDF